METLAWEIGETSHALRRAFDRKAAEVGVTRAQWRVLAHLGRGPEDVGAAPYFLSTFLVLIIGFGACSGIFMFAGHLDVR